MSEANEQTASDYFKAFTTRDRTWLGADIALTYIRRDTTLPFEVGVLDCFWFENGKITEQWPAIGNPGLQRQVGMIPA